MLKRRWPVVLFVLVLLLTAAPASGQVPDARSEHQRIIDYWTPARVASAIPADIILNGPRTVLPGRPPGVGGGNGGGGGGGGGGGDGDGTVNGKHWTDQSAAVVRTTGKVLFTKGSSNYVCSGSVVAESEPTISLVLTAGHCTYSGGFVSNWLFVPYFEDGDGTFNCSAAPYGCWSADALVTSSGFAGGDLDYDFAFVVIGPDGDGDHLDATVGGGQAIGFSGARPPTAHSFGYPHAKPYDGTELAYCAGPTNDDPYSSSSAIGIECKMTGGSSGGPWFADFDAGTGYGTLVSVNSFKYRSDKGTMYGPRLGSYAQKTFNAALGASEHTLVAP